MQISFNFTIFVSKYFEFNQIERNNMAKVCEICGKKPLSGNNISHAHNRTRRRWLPNLQTVRANLNGRSVRIKVCASCLKQGKVVKAV